MSVHPAAGEPPSDRDRERVNVRSPQGARNIEGPSWAGVLRVVHGWERRWPSALTERL